MLKEALGYTIRQERLKRGYNLRKVATNAHMALGYLSEVEQGRKEASSQIIDKIANVLDIPTSQLVYLTAQNMREWEQHRVDVEVLEMELANA